MNIEENTSVYININDNRDNRDNTDNTQTAPVNNRDILTMFDLITAIVQIAVYIYIIYNFY